MSQALPHSSIPFESYYHKPDQRLPNLVLYPDISPHQGHAEPWNAFLSYILNVLSLIHSPAPADGRHNPYLCQMMGQEHRLLRDGD